MNVLVENGVLSEMVCGENFAYVINENDIFSLTEYKVLQSQEDGTFIKCVKALFNGKVQLYYLTDGYKSLESVLYSLDSKTFLNIVKNLLDDIISVKSNGFLSCQNIDLSLNQIYFDPATYKIGLVYLPITKRLFVDTASFENTLRSNLIKLIQNIPSLSSSQTFQLAADLSNGLISLENLYNKVKTAGFADSKGGNKSDDVVRENMVMKLVSLNPSFPLEIYVTKDEFTIGKKQGVVDGVVPYNKMISRSHCKIMQHNGRYSITDLGSVNGTYINGERVSSGEIFLIKNGDIVRLANSEFKVIIG